MTNDELENEIDHMETAIQTIARDAFSAITALQLQINKLEERIDTLEGFVILS